MNTIWKSPLEGKGDSPEWCVDFLRLNFVMASSNYKLAAKIRLLIFRGFEAFVW